MGSHDFQTIGRGTNATDAYKNAMAEARAEYGSDPYNGTISTTSGFCRLAVPARFYEEARQRIGRGASVHDPMQEGGCLFADATLDDDRRCERLGIKKWGRCGCVYLGGNDWLFFGWAAS